MTHWLDSLLTGPTDAAPCASVADWWPRHCALAREQRGRGGLALAIAGGVAADRVAWAFATAYQAALRALLPELPDDSLAALCVTEAGGNAPRDIQTTVSAERDRLLLNGAKRWTTLGPDGGLFLVAARDEAASTAERPALRLLRVPAATPGIAIEPMPPTGFVPEVAHARLRFEQVSLDTDALLPGDGYTRYVKPFRTIEDLHVHAAVLAYLLREARRLRWPADWIERALATLLGFDAIAALDLMAPTTHVALAGAMSSGDQLAREANGHWQVSDDREAAARWQRDRPLLGIASKAREARARRAWERLSASGSR